MAVAYQDGKTEYQGLVVHINEDNKYDDSFFWAIVWDESQDTFKKIYYGSTCIPLGRCGETAIDAPAELRKKYWDWYAEQDRKVAQRRKVERLLATRKIAYLLSKQHGIPAYKLYRFGCDMTLNRIFSVGFMRTSNKWQREFRTSIRNQVISWFKDPAPKFDYPLSPKQRNMI